MKKSKKECGIIEDLTTEGKIVYVLRICFLFLTGIQLGNLIVRTSHILSLDIAIFLVLIILDILMIKKENYIRLKLNFAKITIDILKKFKSVQVVPLYNSKSKNTSKIFDIIAESEDSSCFAEFHDGKIFINIFSKGKYYENVASYSDIYEFLKSFH